MKTSEFGDTLLINAAIMWETKILIVKRNEKWGFVLGVPWAIEKTENTLKRLLKEYIPNTVFEYKQLRNIVNKNVWVIPHLIFCRKDDDYRNVKTSSTAQWIEIFDLPNFENFHEFDKQIINHLLIAATRR